MNPFYPYKLSNIVDVLAKKYSHTHFDRPVFLFFLRKFLNWCVCDELKTVFVEIFMIFLSSVIKSIDLGHVSVNSRIHIGKSF